MATKYAPLTINQNLDESLSRLLAGGVTTSDGRQTLGMLLQSALRLEFATIPPYLSAAYSLDNRNDRIRHLLLRIAREEMLHMTVVANTLNAIGIAPDIVGAVPTYPCNLEMLDPPLQLHLKSFSMELVEEELMRIEAPEDPVAYPKSATPALWVAAAKPRTIGQFYAGIIEIINSDAIDGLFDNAKRDAYKQIRVQMRTDSFAYVDNADNQAYPITPKQNIDFVIDDKLSAVRHLEWIVDQGEGSTPLDPLTAEGIPGHYYRLESIVKGRYLIPDVGEPALGHTFSGADLLFDPDGLYVFDDNPKRANYVGHVGVSRHLKRFNDNYTIMIDGLQAAFNCPSPERKGETIEAYNSAIGIMQNMQNAASYLVRAAATDGVRAGLPFEYGGA